MGSISHLRSLVRSLAGCHLTIGMRPVLVAIMIFFGLAPLALAGSGEPAATIERAANGSTRQHVFLLGQLRQHVL